MPNLYRVSNLAAKLDESDEALMTRVAKAAHIPQSRIKAVRVVRRSVDARRKRNIHYVLQVEFETFQKLGDRLARGVSALSRSSLDVPDPGVLAGGPTLAETAAGRRPVLGPIRKSVGVARAVVVVGAGPAGLFAALALSESGRKVILLERGKNVEERMRDIGDLRASGRLDPESNICFGEGGAGAYSDGKLYTRMKHPYARWVLKTFVSAGADPSILIDAHPHLGTDRLVTVVKNLRERILAAGGEVRFGARVDSLIIKNGAARGVRLAGGEEIPAAAVVLAIGHSARDTFETLLKSGVTIEAKAFAVGLRAEHPQETVNKNQYGVSKHDVLGAAAYALTHQVPDSRMKARGVYSFCMCPGGFIVPSPTEPAHMVVNGMSNSGRSTPYANSGIVVQVTPEDLLAQGLPDTPLIGIAFQREIESAAFKAASKPYNAPAVRIDDFLAGKSSGELAPTNFRPAADASDLKGILPDWIENAIREGIRAFAKKIKGYDSAEGNLFAVESRTSSPVRLTRGDDMAAVGIAGLYPAGEGAGYAGGIVSAAVDGLRAAEAIIGSAT